jgi:aquaporin Z
MPRKLVAEFIGTFFLVLTIGLTVYASGVKGQSFGIIPPLAIGSALMVMIFAGGHISGAHYNPAVTLGVWIRGKCTTQEMPLYMIAQVLGAAVAAFATMFLSAGIPGFETREAAEPVGSIPAAFLAEFLFTFALVYVVLNVATAKGTSGNSFYGLAIGFTVLVGAFSVGHISGGAFNPAVAIGATLMKLISPSSVWIHLAADFAGGAVAGVLFKSLNLGDD